MGILGTGLMVAEGVLTRLLAPIFSEERLLVAGLVLLLPRMMLF